MKISQIKDLLNAEYICGQAHEQTECLAGCGCDLMSDVLAFPKEKMVLLTGLTNKNVIRTAQMLDVNAIVVVRGKKLPEDALELAQELDMTVLCTNYTLYEACGTLYAAGLPGKTKGCG